MANSKADKALKVMDVTQPGKSAPSATSRPIIVSNRPMLRQDPMMVSPDGMEKPEAPSAPPVSRVAKTIKVVPDTSSDATSVTPVTVTTIAAPEPEPGATPRSITVISQPDIAADKPVETTDKKAVAEDVGLEALTKTGVDNPLDMPKLPEQAPGSSPVLKPIIPEPPVPPVEKKADIKPPEPKPAPTVVADIVKPEASNPVAKPELTPAPATPTEPEPDASEHDNDTTENASDDQLAPNQALDEAKRKEEEAKAARLAEQEKIIASKQYYLPIKNVAARRGLARSLIILFFVLILAVVWFDVVLDAGILHIGGLQPVTHFFG